MNIAAKAWCRHFVIFYHLSGFLAGGSVGSRCARTAG
jgi:hypothetical protein